MKFFKKKTIEKIWKIIEDLLIIEKFLNPIENLKNGDENKIKTNV